MQSAAVLQPVLLIAAWMLLFDWASQRENSSID